MRFPPRIENTFRQTALPAAAVAFLLVSFAGAVLRADEPAPAKKLIEWGWDEPDPAFMKAHVAEMERMPFDGLVFHVPAIERRNFTWTMWGPHRFGWEGFAEPLADLKSIPFRRLRHRFLRVNVTPGNVDWFDDDAWSVVRHNMGLAARFAKEGGCTGLMFDTEQYEGDLFSYAKQPHRERRSFAEYSQKVRQRGGEWMREVNEHFPNVTVLLTFGYHIAQPRKDRGEADRSQAHYGLLADFLDGMFAACSAETRIVDAWEHSYGYKEKAQFAAARETITRKALDWTADREKYARHARAGFGLWMDYDWRKHGWNVEQPDENYFSPAAFTASVRAALELSDEYVWIYTEQPRWWTNEKLPPAYIEALRNARDGREEPPRQ